MRYNLKNPLWETCPMNAKEGLERELREILKPSKGFCSVPKPNRYVRELIKEVLGE